MATTWPGWRGASQALAIGYLQANPSVATIPLIATKNTKLRRRAVQ